MKLIVVCPQLLLFQPMQAVVSSHIKQNQVEVYIFPLGLHLYYWVLKRNLL